VGPHRNVDCTSTGTPVFDDHRSEPLASLGDDQPLECDRRRVYGHLTDHGPLPIADLQGDLYARNAGRFQRVLAVLDREGILRVKNGTVEAGIDPAVLGAAETVGLRGPTLTLRPARGGDFRRLLELVRSVADGHPHGALDAVAGEMVADGRIHRWDGGTGRVLYTASVGGQVGGWAHLVTAPETDGDLAELAGGVAERYRGEGIGSRLLQYALERPLTREQCRVYQHIPTGDDDAFQFLRMHGWHVEACGSDGEQLRVVQDL